MRWGRLLALAVGGTIVLLSVFAAPGEAGPLIARRSSTTPVATGMFGSVAWKLTVTRSSDGSYCANLKLPQRPGDSSSECGLALVAGISPRFGITYASRAGGPAPDYIFGTVIASAKTVTLTLSDRATLRTKTIARPKSIHANIAFYVAELPCSAYTTRLLAIDSAGHTVARFTIRRPPLGKSSC
jgi:hypothetical protein